MARSPHPARECESAPKGGIPRFSHLPYLQRGFGEFPPIPPIRSTPVRLFAKPHPPFRLPVLPVMSLLPVLSLSCSPTEGHAHPIQPISSINPI